MSEWEYRFDHLAVNTDKGECKEMLKWLGVSGWELVAVVTRDYYDWFYFKRPIKAQKKKRKKIVNSEVRMAIVGEKGRETATQIILCAKQSKIGRKRISKFQWRCGDNAWSPEFNTRNKAVEYANKNLFKGEARQSITHIL